MKKWYIYSPIHVLMKLKFKKATAVFLRMVFILVLAFILILLVMTTTDYRPDEKEDLDFYGFAAKMPADSREFTLLTWNLGYFGLGQEMDFFYEGGKQVRPPRAGYDMYEKNGLDFLKRQDTVDFILLQELDRSSKRSYRQEQYQKLANQLDSYGSVFALNYDVAFVPVPVKRPMGKVNSGIAIFSKYIHTGSCRVSLPGHYAWPMRLFMLDRCFIMSRYPLPGGKELVIINTHNEAFDAGEMRNQQMNHLRSVMVEEYHKGNWVIAGGDWNMNPAGYDAEKVSSGDITRYVMPELETGFFPGGWSWAFDTHTPTNRDVSQPYKRGTTPATIIDYFITSPNVDILDVETFDLGFRWSDHQPVLMRCRLEDYPPPVFSSSAKSSEAMPSAKSLPSSVR